MNTILIYGLVILLVCLISFLIFFLRNPNRVPPTGDAILAPADGEVTEIGFKDQWIRVVISLSLNNVHVQWVPYPGKVIAIEKFGGGETDPYFSETISHKRVITTIDTRIGRMILIQIAGTLVRRILTYFGVGQEINVGQRFGKITFGSRVELWLPENQASLTVEQGEKVLAGITVVAKPKEISLLSSYSKPYSKF